MIPWVLCDGMPRSASTWAYNACLRLIEGQYGDLRLMTGFSNEPGRLMQTCPSALGCVLKCHEVDEMARSLIVSGRLRVVYTHRHPFDAVASHMVMFNSTFEQSLEAVRKSVQVLAFHIETSTALEIGYTEIVHQPAVVVRNLAEYLELKDLGQAQAERIVVNLSYASMKRAADRVGSDPNDTIANGSLLYSRRLLLHKNHIRDGRTGYGQSRLTADEKVAVMSMLRLLLSEKKIRLRQWQELEAVPALPEPTQF